MRKFLLRRLLPAALFVLALAAALLLLLPARIDWDAYRGALADHAGQRLGRAVALEGALRLSVLPAPVLEADGVRLGPATDQVALSARALRLRLDPWRLLVGRVVVREVALVGADIQLPWPPARLPGLPPFGQITALDARLENSRIRVGAVRIEGVQARLLATGPAEALRAEGRFDWGGQTIRFAATLGRAGDDGLAPLDLTIEAAGARLSARGVLLADGGFEGRVEGQGPDLSALLPGPAGRFSARGVLTATADAVALEALALEVAGQGGRGSLILRLAPRLRLDAAWAAERLDLDAWAAALRASAAAPLAFTLTLEAQQAGFLGLDLSDLRLALQAAEGRITLTQGYARLGAEARLALTGAGEGAASEWALRLDAGDGPAALARFAPLGFAPPPGAVPEGPLSATLRLALDPRQAVLQDLVLRAGPLRLSGTATIRHGPRPFIGLGLEATQLVLDPWLALLPSLGPAAVDVRLVASSALLAGRQLTDLALDAAIEGGRINLRRAIARYGGADLLLTGQAQLQPPRLQEVSLQAEGGRVGEVLASLGLSAPAEFAALPLRLRLSASGPPAQLALRAEAEAEDLRLEAGLTLDLPAGLAQGPVTLRHPGAVRLLAPLLPPGFADWLGPGSLSAIAQLAWRPGQIGVDNLELVLGGTRLRGPLQWRAEGGGGRLSGQLAVERLPLPPAAAAMALAALPRGLALDLALQIGAMPLPGLPEAQQLALRLEGRAERLLLDLAEARLGGGSLRARLERQAGAGIPDWRAEAEFSGIRLAGPVAQLPVELVEATIGGRLLLAARGLSPEAWLATLEGEAEAILAEGQLAGIDLAALRRAAVLADLQAAREGMLAALSAGTTAFSRLLLPIRLSFGQLRLAPGARLEGPEGEMALSGLLDPRREWLDATLTIPLPQGPPVALRLRGALDDVQALPAIGAHMRWRSEAGPSP
ncbi:MAG: AsmA-like C-terminal region-containing protein [Rhodovarius sp.]|nr:AsmA-like C-terminal region-containing protein [Rhodovarius sp.]